MPALGDAIRRGADAIDAARAFDEEERAKYLNASEAMTCLRKQAYMKLGAEKDGPEDWGYARRGQHAETYMVERLVHANVPLLFAGEEQVQIVNDDLRVSCTPDGLADGPALGVKEDCWLGVEFKSIDPRTNIQNLPKTEHVTQLQIGMAMFEMHRDEFPELGDRPIKHGVLVYIDASNFNTIHEFRVPIAPKLLERLQGRANRVLDCKSAARLPREGRQKDNAKECKQRCAFNKVCGFDGAGSGTAQGKAGGADLSVQRGLYLTAKEAEAAAKADKDAAAELIKAQLQKSNKTTMAVDDGQVTLSSRAGSVSYAKVVKEHCPDVDLDPYRGKPSEVLKVT